MDVEKIKTKVLLCREIIFKDDLSYLQGFSAQLGFTSFLKKRGKGQDSVKHLAPFQLVNVLCQPSGQAYRVKESEHLYSFQFLIESVEAQALLNILLDLCKDLSMEQDAKEGLYELLVYAFYALEQRGLKEAALPREFYLKILALAEIKLLFLFYYIQSKEDEPLKEYRFHQGFMDLLVHIKDLAMPKLFSLHLETTEVFQLLTLASKYFKLLLAKDYNQLDYFNSLFMFQSNIPLRKRASE